MKKLIIAEKPSLARNVISALTLKENFCQKEGYSEGERYIVSYAFGHLFGLAPLENYFPEESRPKWWTMDVLPFFPGQDRPEDYRFQLITKMENGEEKEDPGVKRQFLILKKLMNRSDVDEIIHCGDADREGEVIVRLILQKGLKAQKRITRLWLPEQTEETIRNGLKERKPDAEYDNLYAEGLCRTLIDWMYGINLTRYVTLKTSDKTVYGIGRVLTPIVKAIYDRETQIKHFVPETYFQAESETEHKGRKVKLTVPEKFKEKEKAAALCEKLNQAPAKVVKIGRKQTEKNSGKLFSLSKLQGLLGKKYKMSLQESLAAAQSLYEKGYITYPRTNTEYLAENEKERIGDVIRRLTENNTGVSLILKEGKRVFDDSKIESHSALTPTGKKPGELSEREAQVYDTIYRRFCSVFCAEPCVVEKVEVIISCEDFEFTIKGERVKQKGYLKYEPESEKKEPPEFIPGELVRHDFLAVSKMTQPPNRYTSESLSNFLKNPFRDTWRDSADCLDDTEEYKAILRGVEIGTEATRTPIITKAIQYGYISQKNDIYYLEEKGNAMIQYLAFLNINLSLQTSVDMQVWLKDVYHSRLSVEEALKKAETQVRQDFSSRDKNVASLYKGGSKGEKKEIGKCPKCGGKVCETPKAFSCESRACGFVLWKKNKYFEAIGFKLTAKAAADFLKNGKTKVSLPSKKKPGTVYNAILSVDFNAEKYPKWDMKFDNGAKK